MLPSLNHTKQFATHITKTMNLNVRDVDSGKVEVIEVSADSTVSDLRCAACTALGIAGDVELRIRERLVTEKDTDPLSALELEAGSTVAVHETEDHLPRYSYVITTCENGDVDYHTDYFNDLSLEDARLYAIHFRGFRQLSTTQDCGIAVYGTEQLALAVGEDYDEDLMRILIGTWNDDMMWRNIESVRLTFTPIASQCTTLDWNDFVVSVPSLSSAPQTKRRRVEWSELETAAADFRLTVETEEYDGYSCRTETHDNLTLMQTRLYASTLCYCKQFAKNDRSRDDVEEIAVVGKICAALGMEEDEVDGSDLMRTLFGTWLEGSRWGYYRSVTLTRITNRDLIRDVDSEAFEEKAFQLAQQTNPDSEDEDSD